MADLGARVSVPSGPRRRRWRRWTAVIAACLAVVLILAYAGVTYAVYDGLSKAPQACHQVDAANTPDHFSVDPKWGAGIAAPYQMPAPQDVAFHSRDAAMPTANLAGWWVPASSANAGAAATAAPAVILVHGIQSCRRESSVLLAAGMLHRNGYSVFLMDIRDHGDSEGDDARFAGGSDEYLDVLGAWDWVRAQGVPAARIGIVGFSFGSAIALIAGSQEPAVQAVWADSPWTDTRTAIGLFIQDQNGLPDFLVPGAILWGRAAGIDFVKFNPATEVTRYANRHLAFVHGAEDPVLPASMSMALHDAAAASGAHVTDVWDVPKAAHTQAIYVDPAGYEARLTAFFGKALGTAAAN